MEIEIYDGPKSVGKLNLQQQGLYLRIQGSLPLNYALYRVYGICGQECRYLGIADPRGSIDKSVSVSSFSLPEYCLLSPLAPRDFIYQPVEETTEPKVLQTEAPETYSTDPEPQVSTEREEPQERIKTERGRKYENDEEMLGSAIDPLLLADLPADYDYGQGGQ